MDIGPLLGNGPGRRRVAVGSVLARSASRQGETRQLDPARATAARTGFGSLVVPRDTTRHRSPEGQVSDSPARIAPPRSRPPAGRQSPRDPHRQTAARRELPPGPGTMSPGAWRTAASVLERVRSSAARRDPSGQEIQHLEIPDALRGHVAQGPGQGLEAADFLDEPRVEHRGDSAVDPVVQLGTGPLQGENQRARRRRAIVLDLELAEGLAGERDDLEAPDDPPAIVGMNRSGGRRDRAVLSRRCRASHARAHRPPPRAGPRTAGSAPGPSKSPRSKVFEVERRPAHEEDAACRGPRSSAERLHGPLPVTGPRWPIPRGPARRSGGAGCRRALPSSAWPCRCPCPGRASSSPAR